jgi:hypothetical protein
LRKDGDKLVNGVGKITRLKNDEKQKQDITFFDEIRNKNTCIELRLVSGMTLFQVS